MKKTISTLLLLAAATPLHAQQTVHYPDSQHANPPALGFPFYTPGGGLAGLAVRTQFLCPDSFLQTQGLSAGFVTSIGFSLGGAGFYDQFVLRAGTAGVPNLGASWAQNLPDQRIQKDLSNTLVTGGGTPASPLNVWVDFPLDFPFYYEPGDSVVVDLTTNLFAPPGPPPSYCTTTVGNGQVERAYNFSYFPGSPATSFNTNGLKFRFTVAPLKMVEFGAGCSSAGSVAPDLDSIGSPQIGTSPIVTVNNTTPNGLGIFIFGFSKTDNGGVALPTSLGGSCDLLVSTDALFPQVLPPTNSAAYGLSIPNNAALQGGVVYTQFAQYDAASPASIPYVVSEGGILPIY
ncbi:MAG: hypothetical protein VYD05_14365 [Planctomycetota bacterium]|nr:hypothetical protein [Planctomycetota bacterium]MEC8252729.1 hypothetical protein [Planctomycetota bacterium]MEC9047401.1 hypothetical protein [Planctomycetota bacterium]